MELRLLGRTVVFVSRGIISGSDQDFLAERINEILDEQYTRNLSRFVSAPVIIPTVMSPTGSTPGDLGPKG